MRLSYFVAGDPQIAEDRLYPRGCEVLRIADLFAPGETSGP